MTQKDDTQPTRRGVVLHKTNPFMTAGVGVKPRAKRIVNPRGDMMVVGETGEIVSPAAGFWYATEVDSAKFVKLYVNGVKAFKELTSPGTKVFELLYLEMQKGIGKDRVYLSFQSINQEATPMSASTYKRGMAELVAKGFIAPTPVQGWHWLNPDYVFNGDRLAIVREYRRSGSSMPDPRQRSLDLMGPTDPVELEG